MKFYYSGGRFFPMKIDANTHRVAEGLPPSELHTLTIVGRDEICDFLNGLVDHEQDVSKTYPSGNEIIRTVSVDPEVVPDYVPTFLLSKEQRQQRERK